MERIARKIEFNELAKYLNMKSIKKSKKTILSIAEYIKNGKNLRIEPIDSSLKAKCIVYCLELPFGIISLSSYVNIETMNIISSDTNITKNYLLFQKK